MAAGESGEYESLAIGRGKWPALVWRLSGAIRPIIRPPEAEAAQFRDIDIRAGPGFPHFREGKG